MRPNIIRTLVRTSQVFDKAGRLLDELFSAATQASQSGVPPPPHGTHSTGENR